MFATTPVQFGAFVHGSANTTLGTTARDDNYNFAHTSIPSTPVSRVAQHCPDAPSSRIFTQLRDFEAAHHIHHTSSQVLKTFAPLPMRFDPASSPPSLSHFLVHDSNSERPNTLSFGTASLSSSAFPRQLVGHAYYIFLHDGSPGIGRSLQRTPAHDYPKYTCCTCISPHPILLILEFEKLVGRAHHFFLHDRGPDTASRPSPHQQIPAHDNPVYANTLLRSVTQTPPPEATFSSFNPESFSIVFD